jgi:hypothetical protein
MFKPRGAARSAGVTLNTLGMLGLPADAPMITRDLGT